MLRERSREIEGDRWLNEMSGQQKVERVILYRGVPGLEMGSRRALQRASDLLGNEWSRGCAGVAVGFHSFRLFAVFTEC
jgi:hypothetical protein